MPALPKRRKSFSHDNIAIKDKKADNLHGHLLTAISPDKCIHTRSTLTDLDQIHSLQHKAVSMLPILPLQLRYMLSHLSSHSLPMLLPSSSDFCLLLC